MAQLYLYSTNAFVVYTLCEDYFRGEFRKVYAATEFDARGLGNDDSSNPRSIYNELLEVRTARDTQHVRFRGTETVMSSVATRAYIQNRITQAEYDNIRQILLNMDRHFRWLTPIIYIIDRGGLNARHETVNGNGNPTDEFYIDEMPRRQFEAMTLEKLIPPISNP